MSRFLIISFVVSLLTFSAPQHNSPLAQRVTDQRTGVRLVRSKSIPISGPKGRYHSLSFSISYPYDGFPALPKMIVKFELVSVVKARRLNTDLYVVFVVDGKEIHFSSNRSAILRPVRGKPWIGERMVFRIPFEQFQNMTKAKTLSVKLGGVTFDFDRNARLAMGEMEMTMRSPTI
jgi:hypothetical protein